MTVEYYHGWREHGVHPKIFQTLSQQIHGTTVTFITLCAIMDHQSQSQQNGYFTRVRNKSEG